MAPESPSSSWDGRKRRHKYRRSPELNLNQSLNHQTEYEDDDRFIDPDRRPHAAGGMEKIHADQQQFMDDDYDDGVKHMKQNKRQSKNMDYESKRPVAGLDLNIGQASPEIPPPSSSGSKLPRSPNSRHVFPFSRSPPPSSGQSRKSPSSRRRPSHRNQHSPPSASGGRRSPPAAAWRQQQLQQQQSGSSPPSKRARLPARQEERQHQEQRQYSPGPARRQDLPAERGGRRSSPYVEQKQQRVRRRSPHGEEKQQERVRRRSPYGEEKQQEGVRRSPYGEEKQQERVRRSPYGEEKQVPARRRRSPVIEERQQQQEQNQRQYSPPPIKRQDLSEPKVDKRRSPYAFEEGRLPARKRFSPLVEARKQLEKPREYSPSPVRRQQDPPADPAVARRRSPYDERRRSVTPWRRPSPFEDTQPGKLSPLSDEGGEKRSVTPLRKRPPSAETEEAPARKSLPSNAEEMRPRSVTPLRRRATPVAAPGRKQSPALSGERRGLSKEEGSRQRERSRTPIYHGEQSRSLSPMPRKSPSPGPPSRRTRTPVLPCRSPRRSPAKDRSPQRERSPRGRDSPRRRSSPTAYRGSRRDRRSPGGRRGWSPLHNRSNGVGKPGNNLFIAGFNFITTERDLERKFSRYGRVMDVRIVRDKRSGESRGFGFLTLERDEDADAAIKALDQTEWNGRIVLVEKAKTPTRF